MISDDSLFEITHSLVATYVVCLSYVCVGRYTSSNRVHVWLTSSARHQRSQHNRRTAAIPSINSIDDILAFITTIIAITITVTTTSSVSRNTDVGPTFELTYQWMVMGLQVVD
jgi:hypothetical protein